LALDGGYGAKLDGRRAHEPDPGLAIVAADRGLAGQRG